MREYKSTIHVEKFQTKTVSVVNSKTVSKEQPNVELRCPTTVLNRTYRSMNEENDSVSLERNMHAFYIF